MKCIVLKIVLALGLALGLSAAAAPALANTFPGQINRFILCDEGPSQGTCTVTRLGDFDPQGREIWLEAEIMVEPETVRRDRPYAIAISAMASSEIHWNGVMLGANGVPGSDAEHETPGVMDAVMYLPGDMIREGINTLSIHMSSFHNSVHVLGPVHYIGITRFHSASRLRLQSYVPALITAGGLFLAALYFGLSFAFDRRQIGALLLALMSTATIGQLGAETFRGFVIYDYPIHVLRLNFVVGFASAFSLALVGFVAWRFNRKWLRPALATVATFGAIFIVSFSAYDMRTVMILLLGCVSAGVVLMPVVVKNRGVPVAILGALASFVVLVFVRQGQFLDQDFYYAVLILSAVLFVGEVMARRQDGEARREADTRAAKLELELLRRQISPHFLMNTLNVLSAWVEQDPKVSVSIIETLASECRALDDLSRKQLVPLSEELTLCETHLKLMSYRTEVSFDLKISGDVVGKLVPPAAILTLIENAFSHNHYPDGANFSLSIRMEDGNTNLEFAAPLGARKQEASSHGGMGLSYVRARLEDAFGKSWSLEQGAKTDPDEEDYWQVAMSYKQAP